MPPLHTHDINKMYKSKYTNYRDFRCKCGKKTKRCDFCKIAKCKKCRSGDLEISYTGNILAFCNTCRKRQCYSLVTMKSSCLSNAYVAHITNNCPNC